MVTQISLGTFSTQNGKNVLTGGASKLDTVALVNSLATAKRAPAVRLETANKTIDAQTTAINQLKTLFTTLQTAADTLRNPPGVAVDSKNIFQYRTASVTSSTGAVASNYMDVAVQPGAVAQSYTVDSITQLAYQTKQQSSVFSLADSTTASAVTAGATAGLFKAGTINLRAVDGTVGGIPLTLSTGDSLTTVASKFNEISSRTGIQASVLTVATGSYQLVFTATKTGTTYGFDLSKTAPAANAGIASDPSGVFANLGAISTPQTAQNAIFSVDGVSVTRESNSVSDVLDGVTFTLKQPAVPGTLQVNIQPDTTIVSNAITQFADAYNAFKLFASTQSQVDDNSKPKDTAVLYNNSTFRSIVDSVSSEVSRIVSGISGSNPSQLSDIGITLDNFAGDDKNPATKNIMTVNTDTLKSKLLSNFDGVRNVFEFNQTSDNSSFVTSQRSNNLSITSFTVAIDPVGGTYTATYTDPATNTPKTVNLTGTVISGGGVSLKGQSGTIFDGSQFVFAASGSATVHVSISQGFGDRFYNMADGVTNSSTGLLTTELKTLADTKTRNTDEITTIDDRITKYRDQLTQQYANLESAISSANNLLDLLSAQANARSSGN